MLPVHFYGRVEHSEAGAKWIDTQVFRVLPPSISSCTAQCVHSIVYNAYMISNIVCYVLNNRVCFINKCDTPLIKCATHSFWRWGSWGRERSDFPKLSDLPGSFYNQLYQRLTNSIIPACLALLFSMKLLIPRLNKFKCPSSPLCHMYIYVCTFTCNFSGVNILKMKYLFKELPKFPIHCKVKKNIAEYCKMYSYFAPNHSERNNAGVSQSKCTYSGY